ncbi:protein-L-isoaspartate O-methyltransferase [Trypanosoma rangeli]|uniref:protein-L-isoaspartate(D-aspartate) O-methyltransferase n=1 Tax=Trypanosoma rangeli TaxID=5698 RepID=A0A422NK22_TRYRA|nr:protein-L-isoaspartate O-methyltransferase [Trypanosoma rangeli]RNF05805.1 protein-L-isoaspartate O-methyltransferase [Trypanosoma rangeli]|eukprot:RNF05805.1 protein-L-isoaspartate O-methyltransferase [Trypanosoma rangeli]
MAWTCSALSNASMVQNLEKAGLLSTPVIIRSLQRVDRGWFVPDNLQTSAYRDEPLPLGHGATISAPHMHAIMLELLAPFLLPTARGSSKTVLDIGSGSGYLTAVLADICGEGSRVVGVEHVQELQQRSSRVVQQRFPSWVSEGRITFIKGDGRGISKLFSSPVMFDVIHVGAAAASVPNGYLESLKPGGCLVIPVGREDEVQQLRLYTKDDSGVITTKTHGKVSFVPLTSLNHQEQRRRG